MPAGPAGVLQAVVHLGLDPDLTLSDVHRLRGALPRMAKIVIHPEAHGHADGFGAHGPALRPAVRVTVERCLPGLVPSVAIAAPHLDYRNDAIRATVVRTLSGTPGIAAQAIARLDALRLARRTDLSVLQLLWTGLPSDGQPFGTGRGKPAP